MQTMSIFHALVLLCYYTRAQIRVLLLYLFGVFCCFHLLCTLLNKRENVPRIERFLYACIFQHKWTRNKKRHWSGAHVFAVHMNFILMMNIQQERSHAHRAYVRRSGLKDHRITDHNNMYTTTIKGQSMNVCRFFSFITHLLTAEYITGTFFRCFRSFQALKFFALYSDKKNYRNFTKNAFSAFLSLISVKTKDQLNVDYTLCYWTYLSNKNNIEGKLMKEILYSTM